MSRRHSTKQDSLELLLDTICNTFGGVLFIAILVVLLLQQTGTAPASASPESAPVSPAEMLALTERMQIVDDDLQRLRQNRDSQDAVVASFAPQSIQQLLVERREVTARQEALQTELDKLLASNATLAADIESVMADNEAVQSKLEESKERLREAQAKLETEQKARVSEAKMPVTRSNFGKSEVGLILRYGRLYVWHKYDSSGQRLGLNLDEFVIVEEESGGLVTRPMPWKGVLLDDTPQSQQAVRNVLRQFKPNDANLVVIIRPDSFGVFRHLRDRAIELGFNYRLMPVDFGEAIVDRGGRGGKVQ